LKPVAPRFRPPPAPIDGLRPRELDQAESRQQLKCPLLHGAFATTATGQERALLPAASPVRLRHGLGRQPLGWCLADDEFIAFPNGRAIRTAWDENTITLVAVGGDAAVKVWVY
jgi:hypothetical protein